MYVILPTVLVDIANLCYASVNILYTLSDSAHSHFRIRILISSHSHSHSHFDSHSRSLAESFIWRLCWSRNLTRFHFLIIITEHSPGLKATGHSFSGPETWLGASPSTSATESLLVGHLAYLLFWL